MAKRRTRAKVNIPICLAGVLLCLTMFSFHFSSGVVARYTTTASAFDSARVIKFGNVTMTTYGENTQYIAPGADLLWNTKVAFSNSEAATYIFLDVKPTGNFTVSGDGMTFTLSTPAPENKTVAVWTVDASWSYFTPVAGQHIYYIALAPNAVLEKSLFTSNTATVDALLTAPEVLSAGTFSANFRASVVQSNGFTTPEEAWNSLKNNLS